MKILTTTILMLAFVSTLTPTFQIGDTLTQKQAVKIAERFIIDNGYTSLPADKSKLNYELLDQLGENNLDSILKWRHNTLQLKAFCILEDEDKWDIGFLSSKVDLSKLDSIQRQKNLRGRSIVVTKDGKEIRMEHKDPLFSYFRKL